MAGADLWCLFNFRHSCRISREWYQLPLSSSVHIPPQAYNVLWEHAIILANRTFVEGYGEMFVVVGGLSTIHIT